MCYNKLKLQAKALVFIDCCSQKPRWSHRKPRKTLSQKKATEVYKVVRDSVGVKTDYYLLHMHFVAARCFGDSELFTLHLQLLGKAWPVLSYILAFLYLNAYLVCLAVSGLCNCCKQLPAGFYILRASFIAQ